MTEVNSTGKSVGVVGLGAMGGPIAGHLISSGLSVLCADLNPELVDRYVGMGGKAAGGLAEMAGNVEGVLVIVQTDDDVRKVCLGDDGLFAGARPGLVVILCSSLKPATCVELQEAAPAGVHVVDAALTGGIPGVEQGQTNLLVGGTAEAVGLATPFLAPWSKAINHLGKLGSGQVAKTANNLIHWAEICVIKEAFELAEQYGLSIPELRQALMRGPTDSATLRNLEQYRFTWHAKDFANAEAMAEIAEVDLPISDVAREVMKGYTPADVQRLLNAGPTP